MLSHRENEPREEEEMDIEVKDVPFANIFSIDNFHHRN